MPTREKIAMTKKCMVSVDVGPIDENVIRALEGRACGVARRIDLQTIVDKAGRETVEGLRLEGMELRRQDALKLAESIETDLAPMKEDGDVHDRLRDLTRGDVRQQINEAIPNDIDHREHALDAVPYLTQEIPGHTLEAFEDEGEDDAED